MRRRSIAGYIDDIMMPKKKNVRLKNQLIARRLGKKGPLAVDIILDQLHAHREMHGRVPDHNQEEFRSYLSELCLIIGDLALPRHQAAIIQMLFWPEIIGNNDASIITTLLHGIDRVGQSCLVPRLESLKAEVENAYLKKYIGGVIMACQERRSHEKKVNSESG